jgi:hypothetical protein
MLFWDMRYDAQIGLQGLLPFGHSSESSPMQLSPAAQSALLAQELDVTPDSGVQDVT